MGTSVGRGTVVCWRAHVHVLVRRVGAGVVEVDLGAGQLGLDLTGKGAERVEPLPDHLTPRLQSVSAGCRKGDSSVRTTEQNSPRVAIAWPFAPQ